MSANNESGIGVLGAGRYVPKQEINNQMLEEWTGMPAQDILNKLGIETRFIIEEGETASGMSAIASEDAIKMAGIDPKQIGMVVGCGFSGDYVYPAMACKVQELVGASNAGSFDVMANCTGFQVGLGLASDRMKCDPTIEYALVIGTALQSPYINWKDTNTAPYFGDGAGAVILGRIPTGYGILSNEVFSNPKAYEAVRLRGGGSSFPMRSDNVDEGLQYFEINGMEVWKQVVQFQPKTIRRSLEKIEKEVADVDFFVFHQANLNLIKYLMGKLKQPMEKTFTNVERIGNTSDASMAITLCDALQAGKIKRGDLVVMSGVGAGFTFGSTVMRWY